MQHACLVEHLVMKLPVMAVAHGLAGQVLPVIAALPEETEAVEVEKEIQRSSL